MKLQLGSSLDDYINCGDETTRKLLKADGPLIQALKKCHDFFANTLWADTNDLSPIPALLSTNAFMLFLSGIRMAMTGHASAIFPNLRTALESACYAFVMVQDSSTEQIWTDRHKDERGRRLCKQRFLSAVRDTANKLNEVQADSGDWIVEAYESAIDFGAHPNARSVFMHVSFGPDEEDGLQRVNLAGLYDSESPNTKSSLVACMDYGLAIAIVLTRCLKNPSSDIGAKLNELNEIKKRVTAGFGAVE